MIRNGVSLIYKELVGGEYDFAGHVAYSLYKSQKIEEIERIKREKGNDSYVSPKELQYFIGLAQSPQQINMYKEKALSLAKKFAEEAYDSEMDEHKSLLETECEQKCKDFIDKHASHGFWFGVGQSLLASFIFVFAGILLVWGLGGKQTIIDFLQKF